GSACWRFVFARPGGSRRADFEFLSFVIPAQRAWYHCGIVKRRIFNLLAAVSLVLCGATVAIWVRSHWRGDSIRFPFSGLRVAGLYSGHGKFCVEFYGSPDSEGVWGEFRGHERFSSEKSRKDPYWWEYGHPVLAVFEYGEAAPFMDRGRGVFPFAV